MFAAGQSLLSGHSMTLYNASGSLVHSSTFSSSVPNSANQQTVLIGDTRVQEAFGVAPDLVDSGLTISAAGGAACWNAGGIPADCVAWGNFSGGAALQLATGTTAGSPVSPAGITAGKAIRRMIEPGCPTLLEESDDSDDSATDFSEATPAPRNDSSPISEHTCAGAPNTAIDDKPALRSNSSSAEFTYEAPTATSYECKLDAAAFSACPVGGPVEYTGLADGSHTFQVRGVNASGLDPTPASYTWTVDTTPPVAMIDTHPADPSPGATAQFTYHAPNEPGSSFKCSLDGALAVHLPNQRNDLPRPRRRHAHLRRRSHRWRRQPAAGTDASSAGRSTTRCSTRRRRRRRSSRDRPTRAKARAPASPTPRTSRAPASSARSTARPSRAARPSGISYSGLGNGPHTFQVRATDPSDNTDQTPAGYSFAVVLARRRCQRSPPRPVATSRPPGKAKPVAPETTLAAKPAAKTHDRTPTFRFSASKPGASFQCKLDGGPFRSCRSPLTTKKLGFGSHTLQVRALIARGGGPDARQVQLQDRQRLSRLDAQARDPDRGAGVAARPGLARRGARPPSTRCRSARSTRARSPSRNPSTSSCRCGRQDRTSSEATC